MGIEEVVYINITANTQTVAEEGFGVPLAAIYHTNYLDLVREYGSLTAAVSDGFAVGSPAWRLLSKFFNQSPRVEKVKVGRRTHAPTQKFRLTPLSVTEGLVYSLKITRPDGTTATATYTVQASDTVALIIDGLLVAFNALSPAIQMIDVDNTTSFDLTADVAGALFDIEVSNELGVENTTADPGIAADLEAIRAADDDWYGYALDSNSKAEVLAAAAWNESTPKLFGSDSYDTTAKNGTTGNVFETAKGFSYKKSFGIYGPSALSYIAAAWLGKFLPYQPGAATTAHKTLAGVTATKLTDTQKTAIAGDGDQAKGDGGNTYTTIGGRDVTRWGRTFGGQYIDLTRDISFIESRLKSDVFDKLASLPKIPMTNGGVSVITGTMRNRLNNAVDMGILSKDSPPEVFAPDVKNIPTADRANRVLPDVTFTGVFAGAIHKVRIAGNLAV